MATSSFYDLFNSTLHGITQTLLIPVMAVLSIFFIYALINLGILIAEYYKRRNSKTDFKKLIGQIVSLKGRNNPDELIRVIEAGEIPKTHKEILKTLLESSDVSKEFRESLAIKMVEDENLIASKKLEKTDIIAKIAPAIGLMGTLIPLGPGLTALGVGDIQSLAQHLLTAFDAAVLGMASAAVAFIVSKIRRRWYEEDISDLETLVDAILEIS
ncbi:MotA/TolQ/ExbB proton channel family protein [uncultured Methanobacterium sp.]|uniref:MotA/TolQ/ExbB proton channel family protein n=1 Tax=uncultured Methanobacterium sp. TaxID=176306 RepID=UPI002AA7A701|nr:MotA/TolQ/ExbB proton channel family protein [uncultured Methanobacterium sp.]